MRIAVIGGGIAGQMIVWRLLQEKADFTIDWFEASEKIPPCSFSTTSLVRKAGIERGVSPLGDLLLESFEEFESFVEKNPHFSHRAIEKMEHLQCWRKDDERSSSYQRRYGGQKKAVITEFFLGEKWEKAPERAYLVYPGFFREEVDRLAKASERLHYFPYYVKKIEEGEAGVGLLYENQRRLYQKVFLATGWNHLWEKERFNLPLKEIVSGHYLDIKSSFLLPQYRKTSWSMSLGENLNLIHRQRTEQLLISVYNEKQGGLSPVASMNPHEPELRKLYHRAKSSLSQIGLWPEFSPSWMRMGRRVKGVKRRPLARWVSPHLACINGLYKNAYTYSFKLTKDLMNSPYPSSGSWENESELFGV